MSHNHQNISTRIEQTGSKDKSTLTLNEMKCGMLIPTSVVSTQTEILKTKMSHNHQNISTRTEQTGSKDKSTLTVNEMKYGMRHSYLGLCPHRPKYSKLK